MKYICIESFALSVESVDDYGFINKDSKWELVETEDDSWDDYYDYDYEEDEENEPDYYDDIESEVVTLKLISDKINDSSFTTISIDKEMVDMYFKPISNFKSENITHEELTLGQPVAVQIRESVFQEARFLGYGDYGLLGVGEEKSGKNAYCVEVFESGNSYVRFFDMVYPFSKYEEYLENLKSGERLESVYALASNAIYFNDSSDYLRALYEICEALKPGEPAGERYIDC